MSCPESKEAYEATARSKGQRLGERGVYDRQTVHAILDAAFICYVSFIRPDVEEGHDKVGFPSCIPTGFVRDGESLLIHGKSNSFLQQRMAAGEPVCVTVSLIDALVMARSAFNHSVNYRSVMVFGSATPITGHQEKLEALQKITDGLTYPGRWDELRPVTTAEVTSTSVVRLELIEVSGKVRKHGVGDDASDLKAATDRTLDEKDPNTRLARCWAGIIPLKLVSFPPVNDKDWISGISSEPAPRAKLLERPFEGIVPYSSLAKNGDKTRKSSPLLERVEFWRALSVLLLAIIGFLLFR
jgi:nitroimidazol reductase NimA-like FMN-containing flavoprotein (pyridoxamine 5'-phosphate oxidase superfamily)